jgi:NAD-dependent dihydropyrimidine dehydrogenase PreA subunit
MTERMWLVVGTAIALLAQVTAQAPLSAVDFEAALEADYVVVGGGTAGCALAARICEGLPNATVVLLERSLPRTPEQARCFLSKHSELKSLCNSCCIVCCNSLLDRVQGAWEK